MKFNNLFGWLGLSALMLTTACVRDDIAAVQSNENLADVYGTGSKVVTLTVNAATATGTRADELGHISDGSKAHLLYFEVYDLGDGTGTPVTESTAVVKSNPAAGEWFNDGVSVYVPYTLTAKNVTEFPVNIRLAVDPDHYYKVAFWAQHKYDFDTENPFSYGTTEGLTKVTVDYTTHNAMNDELRDAFCANLFIEPNKGAKTPLKEVVLHRPFAQLNVGTTGADYKNYKEGNIQPNRTIAYSKMVIEDGVYNTINVADDVISGPQKKVTLDFAKLPAHFKVSTYPTTNGATTVGTDEEYLYVNLDGDATLKEYKTAYPTVAADDSYDTETFKYMSMVYVLVASGSENGYFGSANEENDFQNQNSNNKDSYKSSTLGTVEVYFAEGEKNEQGNYTGKYTDTYTPTGYKYFTVKNVPVHRNWRTNLLGGLSNTNDGDPDDETSLFFNTKIHVHLCPIYYGEYNGENDPEGDGFDGIFSGYFPTGDNDLHEGKHKSDDCAEAEAEDEGEEESEEADSLD